VGTEVGPYAEDSRGSAHRAAMRARAVSSRGAEGDEDDEDNDDDDEGPAAADPVPAVARVVSGSGWSTSMHSSAVHELRSHEPWCSSRPDAGPTHEHPSGQKRQRSRRAVQLVRSCIGAAANGITAPHSFVHATSSLPMARSATSERAMEERDTGVRHSGQRSTERLLGSSRSAHTEHMMCPWAHCLTWPADRERQMMHSKSFTSSSLAGVGAGATFAGAGAGTGARVGMGAGCVGETPGGCWSPPPTPPMSAAAAGEDRVRQKPEARDRAGGDRGHQKKYGLRPRPSEDWGSRRVNGWRLRRAGAAITAAEEAHAGDAPVPAGGKRRVRLLEDISA